MKPLFLIVGVIGLLISLSAQGEAFNHTPWDGLLNKHVVTINQGAVSQVDYDGFARDRAMLEHYLKSLQGVSKSAFDGWSKPEQLAFLINAYNAWTIELILTEYPDLTSIKDLGSWLKSPWAKAFIPLLGETRSLDDIEHGLIREEGRYNEPRIHFAVNCASIGCPALLPEAFTAEKLTQQLHKATQHFLQDRSRNQLKGNTLYVSKIFDWYGEDFEKGWGGYRKLSQFFVDYSAALGLSDKDAKRIKAGDIDIEFLDYDWKLNSKR
ncbi:DUF547 domain-containing protein [Pseudomonadota bacterium]